MSKSTSTSRGGKLGLSRKSNVATSSIAAKSDGTTSISSDDAIRRSMIAEAAYYRAERRGFAPGFELEDWLQSESELDAQALTQIERQRLQKSTSNSELH
jgi:hypothetical protein